jgi:hypothetical protein
MILTTHVLSGAVIGKNIDSVWLIIPAAIALHFILDSFRHGEYVESFDKKVTLKNTWWKVGLDLFSGLLILSFFIFWRDFDSIKIRNILISSFFSILPDFLTVLYCQFNFKFLEKIYRFHSWVHHSLRHSKEREWNFKNARNDIVISIIASILLFI